MVKKLTKTEVKRKTLFEVYMKGDTLGCTRNIIDEASLAGVLYSIEEFQKEIKKLFGRRECKRMIAKAKKAAQW